MDLALARDLFACSRGKMFPRPPRTAQAIQLASWDFQKRKSYRLINLLVGMSNCDQKLKGIQEHWDDEDLRPHVHRICDLLCTNVVNTQRAIADIGSTTSDSMEHRSKVAIDIISNSPIERLIMGQVVQSFHIMTSGYSGDAKTATFINRITDHVAETLKDKANKFISSICRGITVYIPGTPHVQFHVRPGSRIVQYTAAITTHTTASRSVVDETATEKTNSEESNFNMTIDLMNGLSMGMSSTRIESISNSRLWSVTNASESGTQTTISDPGKPLSFEVNPTVYGFSVHDLWVYANYKLLLGRSLKIPRGAGCYLNQDHFKSLSEADWKDADVPPMIAVMVFELIHGTENINGLSVERFTDAEYLHAIWDRIGASTKSACTTHELQVPEDLWKCTIGARPRAVVH